MYVKVICEGPDPQTAHRLQRYARSLLSRVGNLSNSDLCMPLEHIETLISTVDTHAPRWINLTHVAFRGMPYPSSVPYIYIVTEFLNLLIVPPSSHEPLTRSDRVGYVARIKVRGRSGWFTQIYLG